MSLNQVAYDLVAAAFRTWEGYRMYRESRNVIDTDKDRRTWGAAIDWERHHPRSVSVQRLVALEEQVRHLQSILDE